MSPKFKVRWPNPQREIAEIVREYLSWDFEILGGPVP